MPETFHSPEQVKVFILYLLEKVGYPLEYNDLAAIVIRDGYVDYFDFVTCFHELIKDGHIDRVETDPDKAASPDADGGADEKLLGRDLYAVTDTGRMIARGLSDDLLLAAVREKSYVSAMRHLSLEKRGAVWNHSIERDGEGYIFHCSITDRDGMAFKLDLRADSYMQVQRMRMNFEDKPDVVYRGLLAIVTGNVNYLFEK
ncbi:MAG: DUF4364 family protein [Clostridiales bacterium]|nr:DUF4364 family protein [Clostridiales bacterium]